VLRAVLARSVFALAALSALAVAGGLAVPPHEETSAYHAHALGAYRFGFLLSPSDAQPITPVMAKLHDTLMRAGVPMTALRQRPGMGLPDLPGALPRIESASLAPIQDLAIEMALLVVLIPRLSRPTLRAVAELPLPRLPLALWAPRPALVPPRPALLPL
jgi:hypothetical protein